MVSFVEAVLDSEAMQSLMDKMIDLAERQLEREDG
jgi:hypothetical protein